MDARAVPKFHCLRAGFLFALRWSIACIPNAAVFVRHCRRYYAPGADDRRCKGDGKPKYQHISFAHFLLLTYSRKPRISFEPFFCPWQIYFLIYISVLQRLVREHPVVLLASGNIVEHSLIDEVLLILLYLVPM